MRSHHLLVAVCLVLGSASASLLACSGDDAASGGGSDSGSTTGDDATSSSGGDSGGTTGGDDASSGGGDTGVKTDSGAKDSASDARGDAGTWGAPCTMVGSPGDCAPGYECFNFGGKGKHCTMPCDGGIACPMGCTTNQGVCKIP